MPISCHFQDCKALLVLKKHARSAIASTWTLPFTFINDTFTAVIKITSGTAKMLFGLHFSLSNALAAERKTKRYIAAHPVEPPPPDPMEVIRNSEFAACHMSDNCFDRTQMLCGCFHYQL